MSNTVNEIAHPGVIMQISGPMAEVMILSKSACSSCQVKGACNMSEMEEKRVFVTLPPEHTYKSGQQVNVVMRQALGNLAVFLGYILPFIILLITLISVITMGLGEGIAGIFSLLILVPYYFILHKSKEKLSRKFSFQIAPI
ncbi:MAG: SoxR reducing system RseC family protein [Bacteroidales bacterium]|jgi:sigma-E factor negative regulatory protein RseC|nr:SoxR reducing system RseC family protein [Bacteroidales bacterium]